MESQKQALKGQQQSQQSSSQSPQQPGIPIQHKDPMHSNECDQNNMNGSANNYIGNNRNNGPPPLMSQNIQMPRQQFPNQPQLQQLQQQQQRINFTSDHAFENFQVNI